MEENNIMKQFLQKFKSKNINQNQTKDIRLVSVKKQDDNILEFLLIDNVQIQKIYIVKENQQYNLDFVQNNHSVNLNLQIPQNLIFDKDIKYDVYFITDKGPLRPLLPNAQNLESTSRHFDINTGGDITGYIYFSKSYKRAMLQLKQREKSHNNSKHSNKNQFFNFNNFDLDNNYIELNFDYQRDYDANYKVALERWGQYQELDTEWSSGSVRGYLNKFIVDKMETGFGYNIRLVNNFRNNNDIIYGIVVNDNKQFQITKDRNGEVCQLQWENIKYINDYLATDNKTRLLYPKGLSVENIYLEYKERPVFKRLDINMESYGWIKLDINISQNVSLYKGIHTVYKKGTSKLLRSFNKLSDINELYAIPNKLNVAVKIQGQKLIFNTEKPIKINDVFFTFKNDEEKYPQLIKFNNKYQFTIKFNGKREFEDVYFDYYQYDKGVEYRSVSKFDDIVIMENE